MHVPPAKIAVQLARKLEYEDTYAPYARHCDWLPGGYFCWIKQHESTGTNIKVTFVVRVNSKGKIVRIVQTGKVG